MLTGSGIYNEHLYKDERELERLVVAHAEEMFGEGTLYFDIKQRVATKLATRVTDGLLLDFRFRKPPQLWVVEYELSSHSLQKHVIPQLRGFVKALTRNEETMTTVQDSIHKEITSDSKKLKLFKQHAGQNSETYLTLKQMLHSDYAIGCLVVYDRIPENTSEILEEADFDYDTRFLEFRTFLAPGKPPIYLVGPTTYNMDSAKLGLGKGGFKPVEGPHWKKSDLEKEVLKLLAEKTRPLGRKEIIMELSRRLTLSEADKEILGSRSRWEKYVRFAISDLKLDGKIEALAKNQWVITEKGRTVVRELGDELIKKLNS